MQPDKTLDVHYQHADVQMVNKSESYRGFFHILTYQIKHKLFAGGWSSEITREVAERGNAAGVLLYDADLDVVVLIEQFRAGALRSANSPWLIELVAGMIDEADVSPEQVIHRETKEEAGLILGQVEHICDYWVSPGGSSERMHLYCAQVNAQLAPASAGNLHEGEDIRVHVVPVLEAFAGIALGKIDNASTIMALLWLQTQRVALRERWLTV